MQWSAFAFGQGAHETEQMWPEKPGRTVKVPISWLYHIQEFSKLAARWHLGKPDSKILKLPNNGISIEEIKRARTTPFQQIRNVPLPP